MNTVDIVIYHLVLSCLFVYNKAVSEKKFVGQVKEHIIVDSRDENSSRNHRVIYIYIYL